MSPPQAFDTTFERVVVYVVYSIGFCRWELRFRGTRRRGKEEEGEVRTSIRVPYAKRLMRVRNGNTEWAASFAIINFWSRRPDISRDLRKRLHRLMNRIGGRIDDFPRVDCQKSHRYREFPTISTIGCCGLLHCTEALIY